jgi:hypothetical protein
MLRDMAKVKVADGARVNISPYALFKHLFQSRYQLWNGRFLRTANRRVKAISSESEFQPELKLPGVGSRARTGDAAKARIAQCGDWRSQLRPVE